VSNTGCSRIQRATTDNVKKCLGREAAESEKLPKWKALAARDVSRYRFIHQLRRHSNREGMKQFISLLALAALARALTARLAELSLDIGDIESSFVCFAIHNEIKAGCTRTMYRFGKAYERYPKH